MLVHSPYDKHQASIVYYTYTHTHTHKDTCIHIYIYICTHPHITDPCLPTANTSGHGSTFYFMYTHTHKDTLCIHIYICIHTHITDSFVHAHSQYVKNEGSIVYTHN